MRNAYQNYNVAVNLSDKTIYTYMGVLKRKLGNANYCSAGQLSPLLNDPYYKTIGIGTRLFLGGGIGYVSWQGTQHNPDALRSTNGVPRRGAGTLAVIGDLKQMSPRWLVGTSMLGYGSTLTVGVGIPIPIISEEILRYTAVKDEDIFAAIVDYSGSYPQMSPDVVGEVRQGGAHRIALELPQGGGDRQLAQGLDNKGGVPAHRAGSAASRSGGGDHLQAPKGAAHRGVRYYSVSEA
jgi:uncharacterized protein (DUF39 family)